MLAASALLAVYFGGQVSNDQMGLSGDGLISELTDGSLATLPHALIALPIFLAFAHLLAWRKVLQLPTKTMNVAFILFFGLIVASIGSSSFRAVSLSAAFEWLSYGAALYTAVAVAGRRHGTVFLVGAIFMGCSLLGAKGLMEFGQMKATHPDWRIFGGWVNGNALAAMLVIGVPLGLAIAIAEKRLAQIAAVAGTLIILMAVYFTRSRGAVLALPPTLLMFGGLLYVWRKFPDSKTATTVASVALCAVVVTTTLVGPVVQVAMPVNTKASDISITSSGSGPLGRLGSMSISTDESAYFRRLLWKGVGTILADDPAGVGIGAYRYASSRSGLTTQTVLAHESFLQIASEATPVTSAILAVALVFWAIHVCKSPKGLPWRQNVYRAGAVAAVVSVLIHSLLDSDFYYFGVGLVTFILIGTSLLYSVDAVAPEFLPTAARRAGIAGCFLAAAMFLYSGTTEFVRARLRLEETTPDASNREGDADLLKQIAPFDGDAWYLIAKAETTPEAALAAYEKAVEYAPSTKNLRALARAQQQAGDEVKATSTLNRALTYDPNNLLALTQLLQLQIAGSTNAATQTANRLIAVEDTPYFKIRSIPEMVPTETYEARLYLAKQTSSARAQIQLLAPAVAGFEQYAKVTIPQILQQGDYAGESLETAKQKLAEATEAGQDLQRAADASGDRKSEALAKEALDAFSAALASVTK
jgi:tetratricopeptide (TPR) repeat protein